ncbi:MAG TPA: hypothetical protein VH092_15200 [Urbifossiella sp.]|jgi:hypothetical protein|nr:hypothetical protein [Urbifossiella sp.]
MNLYPTFYGQFLLAFQLLPDGLKSLIVYFKMGLEYVLSMWSLPLEVYLRWWWGVRTLSAFQVCFLISVGCFGRALGPVAGAFLLGSAVLGVWHFIEARRWEARPGAPWRITYSWGSPLAWRAILKALGWSRADAERIAGGAAGFRFLEPGTALLGALLTQIPATRFLGLVILASGAALLLKRHLIYLRIIDATRDRRDAVAIGEILSETSESDRRGLDDGPIFEVELAPSAWRPTVSAAAGAIPARVLSGPDAAGRPKVECPSCSAAVRCPADFASRSLQCPKCKAPFAVSIPYEPVG